MRAIVIYESMYGNTRQIAEAIAEGLSGAADVEVVPITKLTPDQLPGAGLIVVGGPTHMLGLSGPGSRRMAVSAARKPGSGLSVEEGADGPGLREWLATTRGRGAAAAFDTRLHAKLGGRASVRLARRLRRSGYDVIARPQSFYVTKANTLEPGEPARARDWGSSLLRTVEAGTGVGRGH
jgi:hypothetical protein